MRLILTACCTPDTSAVYSNANKYPDATPEDFESVRQAVPLDIAFYGYVVKVSAGRRARHSVPRFFHGMRDCFLFVVKHWPSLPGTPTAVRLGV
jgi:hypothetical protein